MGSFGKKFWIGWGLFFGAFSLASASRDSGGWILYDSVCALINFGCAYYWWNQL